MRKHGFLTFLGILAISFTGCASIIDGNTQSVTFNSDPREADIVIDGVTKGVTPLTITLKRKEGTVVVAKKDGYKDQQMSLSTRTNGLVFVNILWGLGGLLSITSDYANGAAYQYDPDSYYITLTPVNASEIQKSLLYKKMWARNFVLAGYSHIAGDLATAEGEYLSSLYSVFGVDETNRKESLRHLREMFLRHQDIPSFAEAVVEYFPLNSRS